MDEARCGRRKEKERLIFEVARGRRHLMYTTEEQISEYRLAVKPWLEIFEDVKDVMPKATFCRMADFCETQALVEAVAEFKQATAEARQEETQRCEARVAAVQRANAECDEWRARA